MAFQKEAEKSWHEDGNADTPLNLAARVCLSHAATVNGNERLRAGLHGDLLETGLRMNLFGVRPTLNLVSEFFKLPVLKLRLYAHVAWGTYVWLR